MRYATAFEPCERVRTCLSDGDVAGGGVAALDADCRPRQCHDISHSRVGTWLSNQKPTRIGDELGRVEQTLRSYYGYEVRVGYQQGQRDRLHGVTLILH